MPPKPIGPQVDINEEGEVPGAEETPETSPEVDAPVEEEKVTLSVSLLKSLLDWAHGEEEEEGVDSDEGAPEGSEVAPEASLVTEEEVDAEVAPEGTEGAEETEETGVEDIEIQALVDKVKELSQTKEVLTDEDFGEIVAAAQAVEGEGEGLEGVMDGDGAGETAPIETPVTEEIGKIAPANINNKGNNGIGK
jgi:hypothetical protein